MEQETLEQTPDISPQPDVQQGASQLAKYMKPMMLVGIVILVIVVATSAYYFGKNSAKPQKEIVQDTPITLPTQEITQTPTAIIDSGTKEYSSEKGFSFKYPQSWSVRTINVLKGETFQEGPRDYQIKDVHGNDQILTRYDVDISADKADVEHLILSKSPDWQVRIEAESIKSEKCGFQISMLADAFIGAPWKELNHPNFSLLRHNFEKGWIQSLAPTPNDEIPISQIVMNKREEVNSENAHVAILDGCLMSSNSPLTIRVWYHSPYFTKKNFPESMMGKGKPDFVDEEILKEMDKIVESIKL